MRACALTPSMGRQNSGGGVLRAVSTRDYSAGVRRHC
eukprot:gene600-592_t